MTATAAAEYVLTTGSIPRQKRAATFVFEGTVLRVDHVAPDGTRTRIDDAADLQTLARAEDD
jgi:hypothetical protein